jgi:hypothetical protein
MEIVSYRRVFELDRRAYAIDPKDPRTRLPFTDGVPLRGMIYGVMLIVIGAPLSMIPPISWLFAFGAGWFAPGHALTGGIVFRCVILVAVSMWAYRARFDGIQAHRWVWHWVLYATQAPCTSAGRPYNPDEGVTSVTGRVKIQWDTSKPGELPRGRIRGHARVRFREPVGMPMALFRSRAHVVRVGTGERTGAYEVPKGDRLELRS